MARTRMSNESARRAMAVPMPPRPTSASVLSATESSGGRGKFQCFGGSCNHVCGIFFAHASTAAMTHSEIGCALAPRAQVTVRPSKIAAGTLSTPVPDVCTQRTPDSSTQRTMSSHAK